MTHIMGSLNPGFKIPPGFRQTHTQARHTPMPKNLLGSEGT
jgi:hypothetical protein